jgi:hypothetical protein
MYANRLIVKRRLPRRINLRIDDHILFFTLLCFSSVFKVHIGCAEKMKLSEISRSKNERFESLPASTILTLDVAITEIIIIPIITGTIILSIDLEGPVLSSGPPSGIVLPCPKSVVALKGSSEEISH